MKRINRKQKIGIGEGVLMGLLVMAFWYSLGDRTIAPTLALISALVIVTCSSLWAYMAVKSKQGIRVGISLIPAIVVANAIVWRFYIPVYETWSLLGKSLLITACEVFTMYLLFWSFSKPDTDLRSII